MKRLLSSLSFFVLLTTAAVGCNGPYVIGQMPPEEGGNPAARHHAAQQPLVTNDTKETIRKQEQASWARTDAAEDESLDKEEKQALKAIRGVLGKESKTPGAESSTTALKNLKAAKFKVRLEPATDSEGKVLNDDFLMLKDSFTDRLQQLQRKIVEQKLSKKEAKEIQTGSKQSMRLNDLRMQVMDVSSAVISSNNEVQTRALTTMIMTTQMVRMRRQFEMEMDAADYAHLRNAMQRQKRAEAIASATMAMLATYEAVINDNGDPAALDGLAEATLKAFPVKVEATDADVKQYLAGLSGNVQKVKARYEADMRKLHGDAKYERQYKAGIDGMFAHAEGAQNAKSITQMSNDTSNKYKEDVIKCKKGEDPGPASLVGASCKALRKASLTGDTSELLPGAKKAFDETGGATAKAEAGGGGGGLGPVQAKLGTRETAAINGAVAASNGDVDGMLDAGTKMFPGDTTIGASLQGLSALKKGDAKGAINAALTFVPVPGLKDAFGLASKLLFKS